MKTSVPIRKAMILFDRELSPPVVVVHFGREENREYQSSLGAPFAYWAKAPVLLLCMQLFLEFNTLVVRERIPAQDVHEAFMRIKEYRELIAEDLPGAEERSPELVKAAARVQRLLK